jgi:antitoxin (DNA-binding transcriptional repressor) of toxin-antitoxin stability system
VTQTADQVAQRARPSDNLICVRRLTATEAARRFSDLLDRVERDGETFLVERRGRAVASIAPAAAVSGRVVKDLLRVQPADAGWTRELAELRAGLEPEVRSWNG